MAKHKCHKCGYEFEHPASEIRSCPKCGSKRYLLKCNRCKRQYVSEKAVGAICPGCNSNESSISRTNID